MTTPTARTLEILAIDPGPTDSAFVHLADGRLGSFGCVENELLMARLEASDVTRRLLVIEKVESYGMAVGAEVFETVFWSGRFAEMWAGKGGAWDRIGRGPVKMHLCGSMRAKDGNIRQALIDRFSGGQGEKAAKGTKKAPGPLYGVSSHIWAALAVAVTYEDTKVRQAQAAV